MRGALPPLEHAAVEPVPQQIEDEHRLTLRPVGRRYTNAYGRHDVLASIQRDLELRSNVPARVCAARHFARAQKLDHRRPCAPVWPALSEAPAERGAQHELILECAVGWELGDCLHLDEAVSPQELAEGDEGFEYRRGVAEAAILVASRQHELAADAQDRSALAAVVKHMLYADGEIAGAGLPAVGIAEIRA